MQHKISDAKGLPQTTRHRARHRTEFATQALIRMSSCLFYWNTIPMGLINRYSHSQAVTIELSRE